MSDTTSRREYLNDGELLINLDHVREAELWTQTLGVSEEALHQAIHEVGNTVSRVRKYLTHV